MSDGALYDEGVFAAGVEIIELGHLGETTVVDDRDLLLAASTVDAHELVSWLELPGHQPSTLAQ